MRLHRFALAAALPLVAIACTGKDDSSKPSTLTGDMSGAVSVAMRKPLPEEDAFAFGGGATEDTSAEPFFSLVKVDGDGNISPVFNQRRPIAYVTVSDTHVVVSGEFRNILDVDGNAVDCFVVAFPRTATGEAVKCLSRGGPGIWPANDPNNTEGNGGAGAARMPGIATRASDVLFTETVYDGSDTESKLWRWAGGSAENELLLLLENAKLSQPWTGAATPRFCVDDSNGPSGANGPLYCSVATGAPSWAVSGLDVSSDGFAMILGTNLIARDGRVSLADGALGSYPPSIPRKPADVVMVSSTSAVGIRGGGSGPGGDLTHYTPTDSFTLESSVVWERILGRGNFAYAYGAGQLRRVDLGTMTVGTANLLGGVGIIQVTDMSFSTDDNLRLDGTTSTGLPGIVLLDTVTGDVTVTQDDVPRFESVTELQ